MAQVGLIGLGAIGGLLARELVARGELGTAMARTARPVEGLGMAVTALPDLLAAAPGAVVECAGQAALEALGPQVLAAGRVLVAVSVGALARPGCAAALARAAARGGGVLVVASGAVAALDGLAAARGAGLARVRYRQSAPPSSWRGHPALGEVPAEGPPRRLFAGSALQAATGFPKNANVTAAVALAGLGFARTEVELFSDPEAAVTRHEIEATGSFGELRLVVAARPIGPGIRSSRLVVGSVLAALAGGGLRLDAAALARLAEDMAAEAAPGTMDKEARPC